MLTRLSRWRSKKPPRIAPRATRAGLGLEGLEARECPSVSWAVTGGTVTLDGNHNLLVTTPGATAEVISQNVSQVATFEG